MHIQITIQKNEQADAEAVAKELRQRLPGHSVEISESPASKLDMIGHSSETSSSVEFGFDEIIPIWLDDEYDAVDVPAT